MSDMICVTNRKLCDDDFLKRIGRIAEAGPKAIILREKDLSRGEYERLAWQVHKICKEYGVLLVMNGWPDVAKELGCPVQLPFERRDVLMWGGVSIHSIEEAEVMRNCGADWVIAGHVWETDCKAGIPGRGMEFLKRVVEEAQKPVYAIGGVTPKRIRQVKEAGAAGGCVMSGLMVCDDPVKYLRQFDCCVDV